VAWEFLSADEAAERFAAKLGSERDALHHLTVLVRNLQLPLFRQEFFDDGSDRISQYTPEEARGAWLGRYDDGRVCDLHVGGGDLINSVRRRSNRSSSHRSRW
jgi:hypothetical protein